MQYKSGHHPARGGPVTRIIRSNNNVYPSQHVPSQDECIDMDKGPCSDQCNIIDPCCEPRHYHWFETRWVYKSNHCKCLGALVTLPVWLIALITTLTILGFLTLALVLGLMLARPTTTTQPATTTTIPQPPGCFNNGVYNYYYKRCDCPASTCGDFCENCNKK